MSAHIHLHNQLQYSSHAVFHLDNGAHILSQEGVTQGDNAAMAMYGHWASFS